MPNIREADLTSTDAVHVAALVEAYLRQTELEKVERGEAVGGERGTLPERYHSEIQNPATAFAGATVLVGEVDGIVRGVVVTRDGPKGREIKRLWVDPAARGARLGSALLAAAVADRAGAVRLSVWEWREGPIGLYERYGFTRVPSWEARERLVCMQLD